MMERGKERDRRRQRGRERDEEGSGSSQKGKILVLCSLEKLRTVVIFIVVVRVTGNLGFIEWLSDSGQ